ncbi:MAG: hypothetical protein ACRDZ8_16905, partial [Acidimicrobiales bacterium]
MSADQVRARPGRGDRARCKPSPKAGDSNRPVDRGVGEETRHDPDQSAAAASGTDTGVAATPSAESAATATNGAATDAAIGSTATGTSGGPATGIVGSTATSTNGSAPGVAEG